MAGRHRTKPLACLFLPERLGKLFFTLGSSLELCAEEHAAARAGRWSFHSNRSWLRCLNSLIIKISHRNAGNEGCTSQEVNLVNGKAAAQGPAVHTAGKDADVAATRLQCCFLQFLLLGKVFPAISPSQEAGGCMQAPGWWWG